MAKKKKTPEEIAEDNERTNEVGLFNYADAYLLCAMQLIENPPARLRFDAPKYFLLFHAAELYLKSYLRQKGEDLEALRKLKHYHVRMCKIAAAHGLKLPLLILGIFEYLDGTDAVIESRYIRTGSKQPVEIPALLGVVRGLRATVKQEIDFHGRRTRPRNFPSSA